MEHYYENDNTVLEQQEKILKDTKRELSFLAKHIEKQPSFTLSKEDFQKYFAGENFQQRAIANCWLLAVIDSLVSWGNYETVIRKSVKRDKEGNFFIRLPLWSPQGQVITVKKEDFKEQVNINGTRASLVSWKDWIKALVIAYWKYTTGKQGNEQFENHKLSGGRGFKALNTLVDDITVFSQQRSAQWSKSEQEDPLWNYDKVFMQALESVLLKFNPKTDLLTLSVYQKNETDGDRQELKDAYSSLGHYSLSNHSISVEKTFLKNWQLRIVLSNPRDSSRTYRLKFDELLKACRGFSLGTLQPQAFDFLTKNKNNSEEKVASRNDYRSKHSMPNSINQLIQQTGAFDIEETAKRNDVIVQEQASGILSVNARGKNDWKIIFGKESIELKIAHQSLILEKSKLSKNFDGQINDKYPLFLYAPRIVVFIQKIRNLYIDETKGQIKSPFLLNKAWELVFIPNSKKKVADEAIKNLWARIADTVIDFASDFGLLEKETQNSRYKSDKRTISILKNWNLLGIDKDDIETKSALMNFLNALYGETWNKKNS